MVPALLVHTTESVDIKIFRAERGLDTLAKLSASWNSVFIIEREQLNY